MAIYPKLGKPWLFGIHQCSYARIWTENEFNLFRDFGQHIGENLGVFISLNESQKSKEQAEEAQHIAEVANQAKSDFLTNMTHELRTPLNGILGFAQILQNDSSNITKCQHGLNVIEQCGNHLLYLINDVLELTKVGTSQMELYETDFYLPSLLNGLSEIINIRAQDKEINFYLELANDLPNGVHGDERRLRQILLNLLGNAIKFTDQGSVTLKVNVKESEHVNKGEHIGSPLQQTQCWGEPAGSPVFLSFRIEDTGIGISQENLETIFKQFEQVGKQKLETKGTGLGLTISKNFVELMGGQLHVSSQINVGTQFWFEIILKTSTFSQKLDLSKFDSNTGENIVQQPIVFPPIAELEKLYELTLMADIDELEEQVTILAESDVSLKSFVTKMQSFLKKYQVGQLKKWLEGAMTDR